MAPLSVILLLLSTAPALLPCGPPPSVPAAYLYSETASSKPPIALSRTSMTSSFDTKKPAPPPTSSGMSEVQSQKLAGTSPLSPKATTAFHTTSTSKPIVVLSSFRYPTTSTTRPSSTPTVNSLAASTTSSSPSPEQLVTRIRALVRALRDADQLLRALQVFRDQQQLSDDAVLKVMMDDANRMLVEQVEHAVEKDTVAALMANLTAPSGTHSKIRLSAKVPYSAYGKKSAKFIQGQPTNAKPVAAVGKPRSGIAAAASVTMNNEFLKSTPAATTRTSLSTTASTVFSSRTITTSGKNGTVITRIKNDPILGEYKVVIRDLTPSASGGLAGNVTGSTNSTWRNETLSNASGPTTPREQNRRLQGLAESSTAAAALSAPTPSTIPSASTAPTAPAAPRTFKPTRPKTAPTANRRSGKASNGTSPRASATRPKAKNATTTKPEATNPATFAASSNSSTHTISKPAHSKKKKVSGDTRQVVVSATLHTSPPAEREEAAARDRKPLETPLLAGIFPRYGPGAELTRLEQPFEPNKGPIPAVPPATVLLPPFRNEQTTTTPTPPPPPSSSPPPPPLSSTPSEESFPPQLTPSVLQATTLPPLVASSPSPFVYPHPPSLTVTTLPSPLPLTLPPPPLTMPSASTESSEVPVVIDEARSAGVGGGSAYNRPPPRTEGVEAHILPSLHDITSNYFFGESPWIPIFVPPASANALSRQPVESRGSVNRGTAPPRTVVELTKLHVVEATPAPGLHLGLQGRTVLNDALEWRPSRSWQYATHQDRVDANLQDLQHDNSLGLQQLHPDLADVSLLPLSLAESVFYRVRPSGSPPLSGIDDLSPGAGAYEGIPGVRGVDYPAYSVPPATSFTCVDFRRKGYFADPASGCQVCFFNLAKPRPAVPRGNNSSISHLPDYSGRRSMCAMATVGEAMLCPNGTVFSQEHLVCDWWFNVDCK